LFPQTHINQYAGSEALTDFLLIVERGLDGMLDRMLNGMLHMHPSISMMVLPFITFSHIIANKQYINFVLILITPTLS